MKCNTNICDSWDAFIDSGLPEPTSNSSQKRERVGYPCGHARRVGNRKRGWNYCPTCRRHYSAAEIVALD